MPVDEDQLADRLRAEPEILDRIEHGVVDDAAGQFELRPHDRRELGVTPVLVLRRREADEIESRHAGLAQPVKPWHSRSVPVRFPFEALEVREVDVFFFHQLSHCTSIP